MKLFAVASVLFTAAMAVPAPQSSGTTQCASASVDKINVLSGQLDTLISQVGEFEASTFSDIGPLLKIQTGAMQMASSVQDADEQIGSCNNFEDYDTAAVGSAMLLIIPKIKNVLSVMIGKKDQFDKAILGIASAGFIVEADLKRLKGVTDKLASTLQGKTADWLGGALKDLVSKIDGWFDEAITTFENDPIISL
uniref:ARAD1B21054p n=1 Tax=Blastobotrys adeninivorans TaxID=409370 RepID=A0A060TC73_BLAAD